MIEINWRFCVLFTMVLVTIILQLISMRERKVFTKIQKLIEDNTRTNDKLTETLNTHSETMKEQTRNIQNFEKDIGRDIAKLQGALGGKTS